MNGHIIHDEATLQAIYGAPSEPAVLKEVDHIHPHYRAFIEAAPFMALATSGPGGMDVSPRGDPAGFVTVQDPKTLLIPDRRGNNRTDTLRNLVHDDRIALLFLIPGINETLRVNGRAAISIDPALLARFPSPSRHRAPPPVSRHGEEAGAIPSVLSPAATSAPPPSLPRSIIVVHVESVYFQCGKAVIRSDLWNPDKRLPRSALPSTGTILHDLSAGRTGGEAYDRAYPHRLQQTLY